MFSLKENVRTNSLLINFYYLQVIEMVKEDTVNRSKQRNQNKGGKFALDSLYHFVTEQVMANM